VFCLGKKRGLEEAEIHHASHVQEQTILAQEQIATHLSILLSKGIIHVRSLISVSLQKRKDEKLFSPQQLMQASPANSPLKTSYWR